MMNSRIASIAASMILLTAGIASAQKNSAFGTHSGSHQVPETPAQHAQFVEVTNLDKAAAVALDAGQYTVAETDARKSIAMFPFGSGVSQELLAQSLDAEGETAAALQAYRQIADAGGRFPRNLLPYALLLLKAGDWSQAVPAYDASLPYLADGDLMREHSDFFASAPDPTDLATAIHISLGLTQNSWGDYAGHSQDDRALAHYKQAMELSPDSSLANYYYGYGLQRMGRRADAQAAFRKAAALDTGDGRVKAAAEDALAGR